MLFETAARRLYERREFPSVESGATYLQEQLREVREQWETQVGAGPLSEVEAVLRELVGTGAIRFDAPGWVARDSGS